LDRYCTAFIKVRYLVEGGHTDLKISQLS